MGMSFPDDKSGGTFSANLESIKLKIRISLTAAAAVAVLFWVGESLVAMSYYAADAKAQELILTTGMSGREGGGHDWGYMLGQLGLTNRSVVIGQLIFFLGCLLMIFPFCLATTRFLGRSARFAASPR